MLSDPFDNTAPELNASLAEVKQPCRIVAVANVALPGGLDPGSTIDTKTLLVGDRVFLAGQSLASANGIYVVNAGVGNVARAPDADATVDFTPGFIVPIYGGTHGGRRWQLASTPPITVGTSPLVFNEIHAHSARCQNRLT